MKRLGNHVLINVIEQDLGEELALECLCFSDMPDEEVMQIYDLAIQKEYGRVVVELAQSDVINRKFKFVSNFFHNNLKLKNIQLLDLPCFKSEYKSFNKVIYDLYYLPVKTTIKRTGRLVEKFGIRALNNLHILSMVVDIQKLDPLMNLDHSKAISKRFMDFKYDREVMFSWLYRYYSVKRIFHILVNDDADRSILVDTTRMYMHYLNECQDILALLPRKPKNIVDIHNVLMRNLPRADRENKCLNQSIWYLNRKKVEDFVIEVPKWVSDLDETSDEMDHCVYMYADFILSGECQILNLWKDGKRQYTIEIIKENFQYKITQFKGKSNCDEMEGLKGKQICDAILKMINDKK